jgi:hypothetical protein
MKLLSIDVGIKNLSYCIFTDVKQVSAWGILNLIETELPVVPTLKECTCVNKKGQKCVHPAKFEKKTQLFCLSHAKKSVYVLPTSQHKHILKKNIPELEAFLKENELDLVLQNGKGKKALLLARVQEFLQEKVLEGITTTATVTKHASSVPLPILGRNLQQQLDMLLLETTHWVQGNIVIENQIGAGPMVNKMKNIQAMLTQYFVMRFPDSNIHYQSSSHKLSLIEIPKDSKKDTYQERKQLGIHILRQIFLTQPIYDSWQPFFESHTKKDDLSDAFLQGIWFLRHH